MLLLHPLVYNGEKSRRFLDSLSVPGLGCAQWSVETSLDAHVRDLGLGLGSSNQTEFPSKQLSIAFVDFATFLLLSHCHLLVLSPSWWINCFYTPSLAYLSLLSLAYEFLEDFLYPPSKASRISSTESQ